MKLPIFQSDSKELSLMQTRWASQIEPVLNNVLVDGNLIRNVSLQTGTNDINHLLGRKLQGYIITRQRGPASIYDNQDNNSMPSLTLTLISSAPVFIDVYCF